MPAKIQSKQYNERNLNSLQTGDLKTIATPRSLGVVPQLFLASHLEHGSDVLEVRGGRKVGLNVADRFHERLGGLRHVLHLHVVQQAPLLLVRQICGKQTQMLSTNEREYFWNQQGSKNELGLGISSTTFSSRSSRQISYILRQTPKFLLQTYPVRKTKLGEVQLLFSQKRGKVIDSHKEHANAT